MGRVGECWGPMWGDAPRLIRCTQCGVLNRLPAGAPLWRVPCCARCRELLMDRWADPFSVSYCMLCGRPDPSEDKYLLNGAVYHDQCVKRVDELIGRFEQQRADLSRKVNQGWLERFLATLTGPVPSRDVLRSALRNAEKTIKYLSHLRDAY